MREIIIFAFVFIVLSSLSFAAVDNTGLVHSFSFETNQNDEQGTLTGTLSASPPTATTTRCGIGNCYDFNDANSQTIDYGLMKDAIQGTQEFTILWYDCIDQPNDVDLTMGTVDTSTWTHPGWVTGYWGNDLKFRGESTGDGTTDINYDGSNAVVAGECYYRAVTRTGNVFQFYKNGSTDGNSLTDADGIGVPTANFHIGSDGLPGRYINAVIDEVSIWNRSLSSAEITQAFNDLKAGIHIKISATAPMQVNISINNSNPMRYENLNIKVNVTNTTTSCSLTLNLTNQNFTLALANNKGELNYSVPYMGATYGFSASCTDGATTYVNSTFATSVFPSFQTMIGTPQSWNWQSVSCSGFTGYRSGSAITWQWQ